MADTAALEIDRSDAHRPPIVTRRRRWSALTRDKLLMLSAAFLAAVCLVGALAGPIERSLIGHPPNDMDFRHVLSGPTREHPLGTDNLGRDVASRLIHSTRVSIAIGLLAAAITAVLSLIVGMIAGFRGGFVDELLMRFTDTMMALPSLFIVLVIAAMTTPSIPELIVIIALLQWMYPARIVRGETLSLRHREYVQAARASGAPERRIMLRHILPGVFPTLLVATTLAFAWALLTESALSYLGIGVRPPQASWGNMLADAQMMIFIAPELAVYPGLCIVLTVLSINLLGDRLRDAFDPRTNSRR